MADNSARRVELVERSGPTSRGRLFMALGLLIGLAIGASSLVAAATGTEQFEMAIAHFVGVVLTSVTGFVLLSYVLDRCLREVAESETAADPNSTWTT